MPGENCASPGCSISRKDKISIFKVPLLNNNINKKWSKELVGIILKYRQRDESLNKRIQSHKLFICERHFTADQIYIYSSRKSLKEGALPTLNLPRPSANANATNNRSKRAIEKPEEYALSQEQMPQLPPPKAYISFEEFKQRIKNLALTKFWNIAIQEDLVTATFTTSNYVLPTYEIFINNVLHFTLRVHSWILPKHHELYLSYNSSFSNMTLPKFIEQLTSQYMLCKDITLAT